MRKAGPRSPVPGVTIAALLIVVGVLVLITRLTGIDIGPRIFLGSALLVVGLGLIAAAYSTGRTGRGGLIALGIVLSLALVSAAAEPWRGVDGDIRRPALRAGDRGPGARRVPRRHRRHAARPVRRRREQPDRPISTQLDAGVGDVTVIVPRDADVRVNIDSGIGSVDVFDEGNQGQGFYEGEGSGSWVGDDEAEIVLTVNAGIGDVEVSRG